MGARSIAPRLAAPALLPIFRYWTIGIVVLVIISPTNIPFANRMYLPIVYGLLFFAPIMSRPYSRPAEARSVDYRGVGLPIIALLLVIQFIATDVATRFYTGLDLVSGFLGALTGKNTYGLYQDYFAEQGIAFTSGFSRVQYVLLLAMSKLIFIYSAVNFFLLRKRTFAALIFVVFSSIIYLGFGLSRGTFFEVFEIVAGVMYFWFMTSVKVTNRKRARRSKRIILVAAFGSIALIGLFVINAMRRYENAHSFYSACSPNFCFVPWGLGDLVEYPLYLLTVYFGNGGYFMSVLFEITALGEQLAYLIPMHSVLTDAGGEFGILSFMCGQYITCRFVWAPEVTTVISIFGVVAIAATNIGMLAAAKFERRIIAEGSVPGMMVLYFIFVLAISMPTANFYTISSPSIIGSVIAFGLWLAWPKRRVRRVSADRVRQQRQQTDNIERRAQRGF